MKEHPGGFKVTVILLGSASYPNNYLQQVIALIQILSFICVKNTQSRFLYLFYPFLHTPTRQ